MNQMNGLLYLTGTQSLQAFEANLRPPTEAARRPREIWTPRSRPSSTLSFFIPAAVRLAPRRQSRPASP
jgi:hypothetical protein